jgi:hypothetical protein
VTQFFPYSDIPLLSKGERPTLLEADSGNELIGALNILRNMTIETGDTEAVEFDSSGVRIIYKGVPDAFDFTGDIELLTVDLTQKVTITFSEGTITNIATGSSPFATRSIDICEGGETESVEFVVRT